MSQRYANSSIVASTLLELPLLVTVPIVPDSGMLTLYGVTLTGQRRRILRSSNSLVNAVSIDATQHAIGHSKMESQNVKVTIGNCAD